MTQLTLNDTDRLAALIAAKLQVVEILERLARKQLALVESGDAGVLLKLLAAKQTVLAQLQALERQLDPFRAQDPECRPWPSPAHRAQCQAQADRCTKLLAETMELEKQGEAALAARRDAVSSALASTQAAADARTAYAPVSLPAAANLHCEG